MKRHAIWTGLALLGACGALGAAVSYAPSTSQLPNTFSIARSLSPLFPAPQATSSYPLGNDLWLAAQGSADVHIQDWAINLTATTSLTGGGGGQTVVVGTPLVCPSTDVVSMTCQPTTAFHYAATAFLCAPSICGLTIDQDTANAELVLPGNWSIVDGTHLSITPANNHTQPYNIRQMGGVFLDARSIYMNAGDTATGHPVTFYEGQGNPIAVFTNNITGTWPTNAGVTFPYFVTGSNGSNKNLLYRNNTSSSHFEMVNAANTVELFDFKEQSNVPIMTVANTTNSSLRIQGSTDYPRIQGGGSSDGIVFESSQFGTGHHGIIIFADNDTDFDEWMEFDTHTGNLVVHNNINAASVSEGSTLVPVAHSANIQALESGLAAATSHALAVTFATAFTAAPFCTCADNNGTPAACGVSTAATTTGVTFSGTTGATDNISWVCMGKK